MAELLTRSQKLQSRREQFIEAAGSKPKFERVARWHLGGLRIDLPTRDRLAAIQVDPDLSRLAVELIEAVAPAVANAFTRHLVPVAEFAFDNWPVDSGFSKSLLGLEFSIGDDGFTFRGTLVNRAPYAFFIKSPRSVVQELIFKPGREAAERIATDIADTLS